MKKLICPECKQEQLVRKEGDYTTVYVDRQGRSRPLAVAGLTWLSCESCGEGVFDEQAMDAIETARRRALRLLTPEEIRTFRLRLGRTQTEMSELLGIGAKTYCRWESGSFVQSEASDRYLRLLMAEQLNIRTLEGIVRESRVSEPISEIDDMQRKFTAINVRDVMACSQEFVETLVRGELQIA